MNGVWVLRTPAARRFREQAGYANFRLNTIVVGLEAVKSGVAKKPADLAVSWEPNDVVGAADQARGFATNSVMVYVVDALDSYMSDLARGDVWVRDPEVAAMLRNEFQTDRSEVEPLSPALIRNFGNQVALLASSPGDLEGALRTFTATHFGRRKRPSLRARFAALLTLGECVPVHYDYATQFLISWRNRHVHGRSTDRVSNNILSGLRAASALFYDNHAHLDVDRMIHNYDTGGQPTLKEVSSLISITHRVIASVDTSILRRVDARDAFVAALRDGFAKEKLPEARVKEYWGKSVEGRQSKLTAITSRFGFRHVLDTDPREKPLHLRHDKVREIAEMDRDSFIDLMGIREIL